MGQKAGVSKVYLEVTNHCNLSCDSCPIDNSRRKPQHMPFSLFIKGVDDIVRDTIADTIGFHVLGEPLLYPHLLEALEYARGKGLRTEVATNGVLLTGEKAVALVKAGLDRLTISLRIEEGDERTNLGAGLSPERYREGILAAVGAIKRGGADTEVVVSARNPTGSGDSQRRFAALLSELCEATGRETSPEDLRRDLSRVDLSQPRATRLRIDDQVTVQMVPADNGAKAFAARRAHPTRFGVCSAALRNVGVLSNGEVTICLHDYDGHTSLGNLYVSPLGGLLSSPKAGDIRKGFRRMRVVHPYCQSCPLSMHPMKALLKELGNALQPSAPSPREGNYRHGILFKPEGA